MAEEAAIVTGIRLLESGEWDIRSRFKGEDTCGNLSTCQRVPTDAIERFLCQFSGYAREASVVYFVLDGNRNLNQQVNLISRANRRTQEINKDAIRTLIVSNKESIRDRDIAAIRQQMGIKEEDLLSIEEEFSNFEDSLILKAQTTWLARREAGIKAEIEETLKQTLNILNNVHISAQDQEIQDKRKCLYDEIEKLTADKILKELAGNGFAADAGRVIANQFLDLAKKVDSGDISPAFVRQFCNAIAPYRKLSTLEKVFVAVITAVSAIAGAFAGATAGMMMGGLPGAVGLGITLGAAGAVTACFGSMFHFRQRNFLTPAIKAAREMGTAAEAGRTQRTP